MVKTALPLQGCGHSIPGQGTKITQAAGPKKKSVTFLINTFKEQVSKKTKKDVGGKLFFRPTSSLELALGVDQ